MSNRDDFNIMAPRRNRGNATAVFFIVFFVGVALISAFIAIDIFESEKRASVNYVIGKEQYKVSGDDAYSSNGVLMVCFDDIAKLCEMTVTGSADKKIFYARESDQKIEISDGESMVISNNQPYAMSAPAAVLDRGVFVPLDFVKEYIEGITVEYLVKNYGLKPVNAFIVIDWLKTDPQAAKYFMLKFVVVKKEKGILSMF